MLMRRSPNIVKRVDLEYRLWGDTSPDSSPLRSHMYELRSNLDKPYKFQMLQTVRGVGYRLVSKDCTNEN